MACEYIANDLQMQNLVEVLKSCTEIGLDTEFENASATAHFPQLCLIQVSYVVNSLVNIAIIDVLSPDLNVKKYFREVLQDSRICKIIHSAENDLQILSHYFGVLVRNFVDTQVAFLMQSCEKTLIGYGDLAGSLCNVTILKDLQRFNWDKRPLSLGKIEYAANDVRYLLEIWHILREILNNNGNFSRFQYDMENWYEFSARKLNFAYKKVEFDANSLNCLQFSRLVKLATLREMEAISQNLIRKKVISDGDILQAISLNYTAVCEFLEGVNSVLCLDFIKKIDENNWNERAPIYDMRLFEENRVKMQEISDKIRSILHKTSKECNISTIIIANSNELKTLGKAVFLNLPISDFTPYLLENWRGELFGKKILSLQI